MDESDNTRRKTQKIMKFNINHTITVYPNEQGWTYIKIRLHELYGSQMDSYTDFEKFYQLKLTEDGGYKEQMWTMIEDVPMLFHQTTNYLKDTNIEL